MLVLGIVLFAAGIGLRYWLGRRAFYRRNAAGVEEFSSYGAATGTHFLEGVGRLVGGLLVGAGLVLAVFGYFGRHQPAASPVATPTQPAPAAHHTPPARGHRP